MDEELKILIVSELDVDTSAQRIIAQLPELQKKVNAQSNIKIGVDLTTSNIRAQAQTVNRQLTAAVQPVNIKVSIDNGAVTELQKQLSAIGVDSGASAKIVENLESMGVQIDKASASWDSTNDKAQQLLNITIQGTDEYQRQVTIVKSFNSELEEQSSSVTKVTSNFKQQREEEERLAKQVQADNESRISYLMKEEAKLEDIKLNYTGITSASQSVTDAQHLETLAAKYQEVQALIEASKTAEGALGQVRKTEISVAIAELKNLADEYRNAEKVETDWRTKDVTEVKSTELAELERYEAKLENAGVLTEDFRAEINKLRTSLNNAFDQQSITQYLAQLSTLKAQIGAYQEQIRGLNTSYKELASVNSEITSLQTKMLGVDSQSQEYAALRAELEIQLERQKEITAEIDAQIAKDATLINHASQKAEYDRVAAENAARLTTAETAVADKTREVNAAMETIPAEIRNIETRFANLSNPTTELRNKVANLRTLFAEIGNAQTDKEKVDAYNRLRLNIQECSSAVTTLQRNENLAAKSFQFDSKLEKAKADLATVERQWSQLTHIPGLNTQLNTLKTNLLQVQNQTDLNKWTAQFNAFKSEVKAAGANVQSMGDTLKNNIGKVLQWLSATTMLFQAFRLLKSAISTVIDLDTAMIDLRKTTDETEVSYEEFYYTANDTAKALGVTTEEIISQTAEWSRLGYSMKEAAEMAENSAIFSAISPELETEEATDGLISIMKAYGYEAEEMLDGVISKINKIGNEMAVSNADIVEVMTKSSAAMSAANNSFEETVALATAAIEITRDAASVGELAPSAVVIQ